jgi:hypothetical protein
MKRRHLVSILASTIVVAASSTASAACLERIFTSEAQGRNAWAAMWGYITPDQEKSLNSKGQYVEFSNGCYRLTSGVFCNPAVPVSIGGVFMPGLMTSSFCQAYSDCYTPDQEIMFIGEYIGIEDASRRGSLTVTTFSSDATMDHPTTSEQAIASFTSAPLSGEIYVLEGDGGERLEVTGGHPMVLADGTMIPARDLREGEALAGADGATVGLVRISRYAYEGDVWNVEPKSEEKAENIVIAEGFLAGSIRFQAQWAYESYRLFVRDRVDVKELLAAE